MTDPSQMESRHRDLPRGPGPIILLLPVLSLAFGVLWAKKASTPWGGPRPRPPVLSEVTERDAWVGEAEHASGRLIARLVPIHESSPRLVFERDAHGHLVDDRVEDVDAGLEAVLQGLGQQLFEQEDLDVPVPQQVDELVVLLARLAHPQHIVEEELARIRRREALKTQARTMNEDLSETADFGADVEAAHACTLADGGFEEGESLTSRDDGLHAHRCTDIQRTAAGPPSLATSTAWSLR